MRYLAATFAAAILLSAPALAQPQCDDREKVLEVLSGKYKESPVSMGVTHNGGLVEVLASKGGATWSIIVTVVVTRPDGSEFKRSCLTATGEGWRVSPAQPSSDPGA